MEWVRMETQYVTGISRALGGSGDPAPVTALGVFMGMRASARELWDSDSLEGKRVLIQGVGAVGFLLARHLTNAGARVTCCDLDRESLAHAQRELGVGVVEPQHIFDLEAEFFAPCALGGVRPPSSAPAATAAGAASAAGGSLALLETVSSLPPGVAVAPGYSTAHVAVSPDGRFVYGSNRGHNSIVSFSFDNTSGALTLVGHAVTGGNQPRHFDLEPSGRLILVGNQGSGTVHALSVNAATGVLTPLGQQATVNAPAFVGMTLLP
jgi:threonine dehydrogenase-like Zn-dependent dehydrogenase